MTSWKTVARGPDSGVTERRAGSQESIKINSFSIHYLQFETCDLFDSLACRLITSNYVQTAGGQQGPCCAIKVKPRKQTRGLSVSSSSSCDCPILNKQDNKVAPEEQRGCCINTHKLRFFFFPKCLFCYVTISLFFFFSFFMNEMISSHALWLITKLQTTRAMSRRNRSASLVQIGFIQIRRT